MKTIGKTPRVIVAIVLMAILSLSGSTLSPSDAEPPRPPSVVLIAEAYQKGEIDYSTSVLYKVYSVFDPQKLPAKYQSTTPGKSATPILLEVKRNWRLLGSETKNKLAPYVGIPVGEGAVSAFLLARPSLSGPESTYDTTHFQIHYTTSGDDAVDSTDNNYNGVPDYIETMGTEMENVWATELDTRGWLQPPSDQSADGNADYDVYVEDMPYYGYADPEGYADQGTMLGDNENSPSVTEQNAAYSYLALENDYAGFPNTPLYNIQVTAAHEFNHAIQFGYDVWEETWLMEATATWMEDEVYDAVNDNLQYLSDYFDNPDTCMPSETPDSHWYADWIFPRFISEHHGGQSTVRSIWEHSVNYDSYMGSYAFNAIGDALGGVGTSLPSAFERFTAANYVMSTCPTNDPYCYEEATSYPHVYVEGSINFSGATVNYTPPDGIGNYAADYITINSSVASAEVSVAGIVAATDYAAQLVGMAGGTATVIPIPMSGTPASGSVVVDTSLYDNLVLVVMNETPAGESECSDSGYTVSVTTGGPTHSISGYVRTSGGAGIDTVVMNGLPGNPSTNAAGYYEGTVTHGWSGTVTPQKPGYTFDPPSTTYTNVTSDQTQNYVGTATGAAGILLVDDDDGDSYETYYQNALSANGYSFDNWEIDADGSPALSTLQNYNIVIWFTGDDWSTTLTTADQANLQAYLDGGGNLFISGQDIGYDLTEDGTVGNTFFADYLHASYVQDDAGLRRLGGVSGDPIGDGLSFTVYQGSPSEIDPLSPAVTVFTYESSSAPPSTTAQETTPKKEKAEPGGNQGLGLQGISSSGSGAIRACTETYKVVYFAFGFEAINSAADRSTVMDRVMTWLSSCGHPDCFGDFDCDCEITTQDIQQVASRWRTTEERYDLNDDGIITIVDIMLVAAHYGETCP